MKNLLNLKSLGVALGVLWIGATGSLSAFLPQAELDFAGGWRRDHLRSNITVTDSSAVDTVTAEGLDIWQVGVKGYYAPTFDDCSCWSWLNGVYLRGDAFWGWGNDGVYSHRIVYDPADLCDPVLSRVDRNRADVRNARTNDWDVGIGYLFGCDCFHIGPVVGYSYHKLDFKARNNIGITTVNNPCFSDAGCFCDPDINQQFCSHADPFSYVDEGVKFSSKWRGPWVGFDAIWGGCDYRLYASYSYHWARWKGSFSLAGADLTDCYNYSDRRKGRNGHGHEACIGGSYTISQCWDIGLNVSYKYYTVKSHNFRPQAASLVAVGCDADEIDHIKTTWHTVAVTLDVGYVF